MRKKQFQLRIKNYELRIMKHGDAEARRHGAETRFIASPQTQPVPSGTAARHPAAKVPPVGDSGGCNPALKGRDQQHRATPCDTFGVEVKALKGRHPFPVAQKPREKNGFRPYRAYGRVARSVHRALPCANDSWPSAIGGSEIKRIRTQVIIKNGVKPKIRERAGKKLFNSKLI
jgi:hypothetical protein